MAEFSVFQSAQWDAVLRGNRFGRNMPRVDATGRRHVERLRQWVCKGDQAANLLKLFGAECSHYPSCQAPCRAWRSLPDRRCPRATAFGLRDPRSRSQAASSWPRQRAAIGGCPWKPDKSPVPHSGETWGVLVTGKTPEGEVRSMGPLRAAGSGYRALPSSRMRRYSWKRASSSGFARKTPRRAVVVVVDAACLTPRWIMQ